MLCDHNTGHGHLRSPGEKGQTNFFRDLELHKRFSKNLNADMSTNGTVLHGIFEDIDLKFCTHIHETPQFFLKIWIWGETVSKRTKTGPFFENFRKFSKF